jgi:hypothetical protein
MFFFFGRLNGNLIPQMGGVGHLRSLRCMDENIGLNGFFF